MAELIGDKGKPRLVAAMFDNVLAVLLAFLVSSRVPGLADGARTALLVVTYLAYYFVLEALWSRTLVKRFAGLVIVKRTSGEPAGWREAAIRTVLRVLEANPLLFGILPGAIVVARSRYRQRLGDMLAGTVVVSSRRTGSPHGLALTLSLCLFLGACVSTPRHTRPQIAELADGSVAALLEHLRPTSTIVEGDPIETTTIEELIREHQTPGVSVAVIRNGRIEWTRGFGLADVGTGRAVTPQTLFQAASISKPVAAVAALRMVQDGLLELDEDVNLKLKSWKVPANEFTAERPVTLRHLLSHTAGTTVSGFPGYPRDARLPGTIDILEGRGNTDPVRVETTPGSIWQYSGGGYTIIQQLMVDVAGKPYAEILRERVLEPAGMTHSTYEVPLPLARENEASTAYADDGSAIEGRYHSYPEGGGLWTTAEDLARFALAIQQSRAGMPGSLLSSHLVNEMLTPVMNHYGLGFGLSEDGRRFGHSGANEGFFCVLSASLDDGWGIVVMTNGNGGWPLCELVRMAAAKAYGWPAFEPTRRRRVDIGEVALARIAGTYEILPESAEVMSRIALFPNMGTIELKASNGRLIADVPEGAGTQGRVEFLPQSELQAMERVTGRLMDFLVVDGKVTGFRFRDFEARRVD